MKYKQIELDPGILDRVSEDDVQKWLVAKLAAARNALLPFADNNIDGGFTAMRIVNMIDHDMRGAACVALFTAMTWKVEL